jgi:hypothetical protein
LEIQGEGGNPSAAVSRVCRRLREPGAWITFHHWYIGNRSLVWSWVPKYLIQPFGAAVLAVVFYLVIRGGFFSADAGSQHTSPFGFMALSAMVGMFSEQAVLKLKEIAETLLSKPPPGKDAEPEKRQS